MDASQSEDETESLSFSKRRALKLKQKKRKPKRRLKSLENQTIETNPAPPKEQKNNFETIRNANELQIDSSDIMSDVELIKRKIDNMFDRNDDTMDKKKLQCCESYLQTSSFQFTQLLSDKNLLDDGNEQYHIYNNRNLIMDQNITFILRNEMMRIFTWIIGIVEGVLFISLFAVANHSNAEFLHKFGSLVVIIQFMSYVVALLLVPYSFIFLNIKTKLKTITKYQIRLFVLCTLSIFICCMIEFPISDEINYLYKQDNEYFSDSQNVHQMSSKVIQWKKIHVAKFCFLSFIWVLCICLLHEIGAISNEKEE